MNQYVIDSRHNNFSTIIDTLNPVNVTQDIMGDVVRHLRKLYNIYPAKHIVICKKVTSNKRKTMINKNKRQNKCIKLCNAYGPNLCSPFYVRWGIVTITMRI